MLTSENISAVSQLVWKIYLYCSYVFALPLVYHGFLKRMIYQPAIGKYILALSQVGTYIDWARGSPEAHNVANMGPVWHKSRYLLNQFLPSFSNLKSFTLGPAQRKGEAQCNLLCGKSELKSMVEVGTYYQVKNIRKYKIGC